MHPKVKWPVVIGAFVTIGAWAADQFVHVKLPPEIVAAIMTGLMGVVGYSAPGGSNA